MAMSDRETRVACYIEAANRVRQQREPQQFREAPFAADTLTDAQHVDLLIKDKAELLADRDKAAQEIYALRMALVQCGHVKAR